MMRIKLDKVDRVARVVAKMDVRQTVLAELFQSKSVCRPHNFLS